MISVNLFVPDSAVAIKFYNKAFGAISYNENLHAAKGERHTCFRIEQDTFALADENQTLGSKSPITLGGVPICIQLFVDDVETCIQSALQAGAKLIAPSTSDVPILSMPDGVVFGNVVDPFGFVWSISKVNEEALHDFDKSNQNKSYNSAKPRHYWSKEVSNIDFFVDHNDSKAVCRWQARNEMLIKKGAVLKQEATLNKDGSLGFAAKFAFQLREMNKDKIDNFVTTEDIVLKSVNEVGNFLYFAGTNSWLVLKDKDGKTINDYTVK